MDFITTSAQNLAPTAVFTGRKRVAIFGDSHLALGYRDTNCLTSGGQFVVSDDPTLGRIATIDSAGSTGQGYSGIGNYVSLLTLGDPTYTLALNGACTPILKFNSSTQFVVSATYGGQTMAVGDYSNVLSSGYGWIAYFTGNRSDSSLFNWIRMLNNDPFDVTGIYAITGALGTSLPYQVARSAYGPAYDIAVISVGSNDMSTNPAATAMANCYKVFYALQQSVTTLQAAGKQVIVQLPIPTTVVNTNQLPMAESEAVFRRLVANWAGKNNVLVIDAYAQMIDGTSTTGAAYSTWAATGNHISTVGAYNIAKLQSISQILTQNPYNIDYQPVSIIEDNTTYAQTATAWAGLTTYAAGAVVRNGVNVYYCTTGGQSASSGGPTGTGAYITDNQVIWTYIGPSMVNLVTHGLMDGTGGSNNTSAAFIGTVPTGWSLGKTGTVTGTTTGDQTRTSITGTNSSRWGKQWYLSAVFGAASESVSCTQDIFSKMTVGNWYQFGLTLTVLNSWGSTVKDINCRLSFGGGTSVNAYEPRAIYPGNNDTTYPLTTNDVMTLKSEPFYYGNGGWGVGTFFFTIDSAAAGTAQFAISSAWLRLVPNPTI